MKEDKVKIPPPVPTPTASRVSPHAVWSLVLAVASFVVCLGPLAAIPAVICGHVGQRRVRRSDGSLKGNGLANAGIILGYINIAIVIGFIGLVAQTAITLPQRRHNQEIKDCMKNLFLIDACKEQIARDYGLKKGDVVPREYFRKYEEKRPFVCPGGGSYTIGRVGGPSSCSIEEHDSWHRMGWKLGNQSQE